MGRGEEGGGKGRRRGKRGREKGLEGGGERRGCLWAGPAGAQECAGARGGGRGRIRGGKFEPGGGGRVSKAREALMVLSESTAGLFTASCYFSERNFSGQL